MGPGCCAWGSRRSSGKYISVEHCYGVQGEIFKVTDVTIYGTKRYSFRHYEGHEVALNLIETETAQQPKFPGKPWTLSLQITKQEAKWDPSSPSKVPQDTSTGNTHNQHGPCGFIQGMSVFAWEVNSICEVIE